MNRLIGGLFAAFAIAAASPGAASTVTLNYAGSGPFGDPNLQQRVDIQYTGPNSRSYNNLRAGPFHMTDGVDTFLAWCVDIFQSVGNGVQYQTASSNFSSERESLLNRLFTSFYSDVDTGLEGAAFQLAIWEIVNEDIAANGLGIGGGLFSASDNVDATNLAATYLSSMGTDEGYVFSYYNSRTNQDLLRGTLAPVPLPAGAVLLLTGLGALAVARRRRSVDT